MFPLKSLARKGLKVYGEHQTGINAKQCGGKSQLEKEP